MAISRISPHYTAHASHKWKEKTVVQDDITDSGFDCCCIAIQYRYCLRSRVLDLVLFVCNNPLSNYGCVRSKYR